ncbi:MAG: hypothetical protein IPJ37_02535 [Bacteroidales bacterium]|nr:hypothetical protein [Bacteroidales bacterium]
MVTKILKKSGSYARYWQKQYAPELMLNEALSFIGSVKDQPLFPLLYHYNSPCTAAGSAEMGRKIQEKIGDEKPYTGGNGYFPCRYPMATYAAMVSYLDFQTGAIVDELKKRGL